MSPKACSYGKRHRPQDNPRAGPARELAAPGVNVAHSGSRPSVTVCFLKNQRLMMLFQTWFASPQATSLHGFTADQTRQPSSSAMNEDERGGCGRGRCTREASRVRAWRKNHSPRARALPLSLRTALIFSHVSWQRARHPVVPTRAVRCRRLTLSALTLNYESALTLSFSLSSLYPTATRLVSRPSDLHLSEFLADSFQSNLLRTLHDGDAFSDATVVLGRQVKDVVRAGHGIATESALSARRLHNAHC